MRQAHQESWFVRFARGLGLDPFSRRGRTAIAGTSKHGRAKTKPRDLKRREKIRRRIAAASRRRNRV